MKNRIWNVAFAMLILLASVPASRGEEPSPQAEAAKPKETILVFAAASTTNALNEIKAQFTKDTGVAVQTNYAASSTLAQQVVHGAEADLFISADAKWADCLAKKDQVVRQQDLLGNRLVIVVPIDSKIDVKKPEDLLGRRHRASGLGRTAVGAGRHLRQASVDEAGALGPTQGERSFPPGMFAMLSPTWRRARRRPASSTRPMPRSARRSRWPPRFPRS